MDLPGGISLKGSQACYLGNALSVTNFPSSLPLTRCYHTLMLPTSTTGFIMVFSSAARVHGFHLKLNNSVFENKIKFCITKQDFHVSGDTQSLWKWWQLVSTLACEWHMVRNRRKLWGVHGWKTSVTLQTAGSIFWTIERLLKLITSLLLIRRVNSVMVNQR